MLRAPLTYPPSPRMVHRRRFLATTVAAAAGLAGLSACSDGAGSPAPSDSASAGGAFPARIDTKFGTVTVTSAPQRVVALGWGDAETALALGVQPVGASDWLAFGGEGVGPWAKGLYTKAPTIIGTLEPSYEKIAALMPDLILDTKSSGDQDRYEKLAQIATTVGVPKGGDTYVTTMKQQVTMIAAALGVPDKGGPLLDKVADAFAQAKKAHPEFAGKTVSVVAYSSDGWGGYIGTDARVQFMQNLGFTQNPKIEALAKSGFYVQLAEEKLGLLDADLLIVLPIGTTAQQITAQKLYAALPVVKAGRSLIMDTTIGNAFSTDTTLSTGYAIDKVVPLVAKALS